MPVPPTLDSAKVQLRPLSHQDVNQSYQAWLADAEVNRYLETRHLEQTLDRIRDFVEAKMNSADEYLFAIVRSDNDRHIGNIKLGPVKTTHKLADVSLFIGDRASWGGGFGSAAIAGVTRFALGTLQLNKVVSSVYAPNVGSVRAFLKVGWRKEAILKEHYMLDGSPCDLVIMGMWRTIWDELPL